MVPNHLELEALARHVAETRMREADAQRLLKSARAANRSQPPPALLQIVNSGSRVRWWFRSRAFGSQSAGTASTPAVAAEFATTISLDTASAPGAPLSADSYEALMVIARGRRQRHERLVTRR